MKTTSTGSGSSNDDDAPQRAMREALQRDAAKVTDAPFNAGLHYETMRRIRGLAETKKGTEVRWGWIAAATGACACAALVAFLHFGNPVHEQSAPRMVATKEISVPLVTKPVSAWAYAVAARQGDEALLAVLDRDAQRLLPPTASVFSTPLN
jgi:hypothetical protein